jgi:AmmeMemoRadiSam system protein B
MTGGKGPNKASEHKGTVRRSVYAGRWYPGDARGLRKMIQEFLDNVPPQALKGELLGLISPHAGYAYSGQTAAYAYAQLRPSSFAKVVVVSPVHHAYPGRFGTSDKDYYETPLGLVPVDHDLLEAVEKQVHVNRVSQDPEHSLEIQLPFLQHVLGDLSLVPIMMGDQDWESASELGKALASVILSEAKGDHVLLVASTDLSHFHPYDVAVRLDQMVLDHIAAYDPQGLMATLAMGKAEACGGGPVAAVMVAAQELGANQAAVLKYMNSGDVSGDRSSVVGYAAVALLRT